MPPLGRGDTSLADDPIRKRHQDLQGLDRRTARRHGRDREGRVRLHRRGFGLGQDDLHPPPAAGGAPRHGPDPRGRPQHRGAAQVAGALPASQHRLRLPGLPPPAQQDRVRERGVRARGHRPAPARGGQPGAPGVGPGRSGQQVGQPAQRAFRRGAAARRGGPRLRQPAAHPAGRRADGQPRPADGPGHHAAARPHQPDGDDGCRGDPRRGAGGQDAPARARAEQRRDGARPGARCLRVRRLGAAAGRRGRGGMG